MLLGHLGDLHPADQHVGKPDRVLEAERGGHRRPAEASVEQDHLLPGNRDRGGHVGGDGGLAVGLVWLVTTMILGGLSMSINARLVRSLRNASAADAACPVTASGARSSAACASAEESGTAPIRVTPNCFPTAAADRIRRSSWLRTTAYPKPSSSPSARLTWVRGDTGDVLPVAPLLSCRC